jgi:hypothetical protein
LSEKLIGYAFIILHLYKNSLPTNKTELNQLP